MKSNRKRNVVRKAKGNRIRPGSASATLHANPQSGFVPENPPSSNYGVRDSPPEAGHREPESGLGFVSQSPSGVRGSSPEAAAAPSLLQPQKTEDTVRSVRSESANGAAESCCHGQSESASVARGNVPSDVQAPMAVAEASASNVAPQASQSSALKASAANSSSEAGSREPESALTPNPDIPDKPNTAPVAANPKKNQHDPPAKTVPMSTPEFFRTPDIHAQAATVPRPKPMPSNRNSPSPAKPASANSTPSAWLPPKANSHSFQRIPTQPRETPTMAPQRMPPLPIWKPC